jgi:transcriptional regulator with XRE-family HTH domain
MTALDYPGVLSREALAGWQTTERRRRLGLTQRELARLSGLTGSRLGDHEDGSVALSVDERAAMDAVLSAREATLGLPSVALEYVPSPDATPERDTQIRADVMRILFAPRSAHRAAVETLEKPPPKEETAGAPHPAVSPSLTSTATRPLSTGGQNCA